MNPAFAEHVTTQAFALTLSRPMIAELLRIIADTDAHGCATGNGMLAAQGGLMRRGLVVHSMRLAAECPQANGKGYREGARLPVNLPTLAGRLVAELCKQAGLAPEPAAHDAVLAEMERRQLMAAEHERVRNIHEAQRHEDFIASIKLKPKYQRMVDRGERVR